MKELIIKKIVEVVWPWVVKNIWPIVQQYLINLCAEGIAWLVQSIKDIFKERSKQRADEANFNAKEAESKASESEADSKEYHAYKAEAEVWRKVAEQYERDIEELKRKVSNLEAESTRELVDEIKEFTPVVTVSNETPQVTIGDTIHRLPRI